MIEALKRSSDVDTLNFHNTGLSNASIAVLAEDLRQTTVRCLAVDYNDARSSSLSTDRSPTPEHAHREEMDSLPTPFVQRNLAGLVSEGINCAVLSYRSGTEQRSHL